MSALQLGAGDDVRTGAAVARANPVAKLAVALLISVMLLLTVDVVTAGTALALELAALPWCGLSARGLLRRGWIVLAGAIPAGIVTVWLGVDSGAVLLAVGPVTVTQGSLLAGCAITLRILSVGLPGVVLLATTDPTDLADALAQVARLPHRFVLAALAAMRLFALLGTEWAAPAASATTARSDAPGPPSGRCWRSSCSSSGAGPACPWRWRLAASGSPVRARGPGRAACGGRTSRWCSGASSS